MYNIELTKYFSYKPRFDDVFSNNNLLRVKYGTYVKSIDDKKSNETHRVSLFIDKNTAVYFDSFGIEYIPQEILNKIKDKYVTQNILRIQEDDFIMCRFYGKTCRKKFETFHKML